MTQQIQELIAQMNVAKAKFDIQTVKHCVNEMRKIRNLEPVNFAYDEERKILFLFLDFEVIAHIEF